MKRRFQCDLPLRGVPHLKRHFGRVLSTLFSAGGFSLVEVTLALGIMAFSFLVIFGLLGTGLTAFRQAKGVSVSSQIAQEIFSQVAVMPFNILTDSAAAPNQPTYYQLPNPNTLIKGTNRYFDEQGDESAQAGAVYWVNVSVRTATPFVGVTPQVSNAGLATVTIQVAYNPGNLPPDGGGSGANYEWTGTANGGSVPLQIYTYVAFVAQSS